MTTTISDEGELIGDGGTPPGLGERPHTGLLALVVGSADCPRCTIYPPDVAVPLRSMRWITATGDSFVALAECR